MSRGLDASTLATLNSRFELNAVCYVLVPWPEPPVGTIAYITESVASFPIYTSHALLKSISPISEHLDARGRGSLIDVHLTIEDPDETFKGYISSYGLEGRAVTVGFYLDGESDGFDIFVGYARGPITYNEGERTIEFDVIQDINDIEVGFAPTEANLSAIGITNIDLETQGKPWPFCFGAPLLVPAVHITKTLEGVTASDVTIEADDGAACSTFVRVAYLENGDSPFGEVTVSGINFLELDGRVIQVTYNAGSSTNSYMHFDIGASFDTGINTGKYGTVVTLAVLDRVEGDPDVDNPKVLWLANDGYRLENQTVTIGGSYQMCNFCEKQEGRKCYFSDPWFYHVSGETYTPDSGDTIIDVRTFPMDTNFSTYTRVMHNIKVELPTGTRVRYWYSVAGVVAGYGLPGETFIVNRYHTIGAVNTSVRSVKAWRVDPVTKIRQLKEVPYQAVGTTYYTIGTVTCASVASTAIGLTLPLSEYNEGWEDEIFVTVQSALQGGIISDPTGAWGNVAYILEWLIATWAGYTADSTTFTAAKAHAGITDYPASFALLDKRNLVDLIYDIAWQARCHLHFDGVNFYLIYLADTPSAVADVSVSTASWIARSFQETQPTVLDFITATNAQWRPTMADEAIQSKIWANAPVASYGWKEEDWDFYIYNQFPQVAASAAFWLWRYGNPWRRFKVNGTLPLIKYSVMDACTVVPGSYLPAAATKGVVLETSWDVENSSVELLVELPIKAHETAVDSDYWSIP